MAIMIMAQFANKCQIKLINRHVLKIAIPVIGRQIKSQ